LIFSHIERQHNMNVEFRSFDADIVEVRSADSGDGMTFGGYAARFNSPSLPLPFIETIAPGAFDRTLKSKNDIRAYINHDERLILGSTRAKTLRLDNRSDGLYSEIDLPDTTYARDLSVSIQRGDVRTMSFGFSTVKDKWQDANNRTLVEVRLHEVSVVSGVAAYESTTASVRNLTLIAKRTSTDIEALSDAIAALEAGEMSNDQADVLLSVVDRSRPAVDVVEPEHVAAITPLTVLMKQLDLIAKNL
jgi:HK97 family phage prohead protease